jgi:hypothetical protein
VQNLHVDLKVRFVKVRGTSPKVFKLRHLQLAPGETVNLEKLVSLARYTTRTPQPGRHTVALLVNGARMEAGHFNVVSEGRHPTLPVAPCPAPRQSRRRVIAAPRVELLGIGGTYGRHDSDNGLSSGAAEAAGA